MLTCRPSAFGILQRLASFVVFSAEFGAVGFACGLLGTAVVRHLLPPSPPHTQGPGFSQRQSVRVIVCMAGDLCIYRCIAFRHPLFRRHWASEPNGWYLWL